MYIQSDKYVLEGFELYPYNRVFLRKDYGLDSSWRFPPITYDLDEAKIFSSYKDAHDALNDMPVPVPYYMGVSKVVYKIEKVYPDD